ARPSGSTSTLPPTGRLSIAVVGQSPYGSGRISNTTFTTVIRAPSIQASCLVAVERVEVGGMPALDHPALELQRRRQRAVLDGQLVIEDGEPLDRLPARQPRVELVHVVTEGLVQFR